MANAPPLPYARPAQLYSTALSTIYSKPFALLDADQIDITRTRSLQMAQIPHILVSTNTERLHNENQAFLRLPAELRNLIYDLVLKYNTPLCIVASTNSQSQNIFRGPNPLEGRLAGHLDLEIFQTCRTMYHETRTRLFQNNTFMITRSSQTATCHDPVGKFIGLITPDWLDSLGSCAYPLEKVVIELDTLCPRGCFGQDSVLNCWDIFRREDELIEVHPLLQALWNMDFKPSLEVRQPQGLCHRKFQSWSRMTCNVFDLGRFDLDVTAITSVLCALLHDQLDLRRYGRQLGGIGIKRDGSGGAVSWAPITGLKSRGILPPYPDRLSHQARACLSLWMEAVQSSFSHLHRL
jgi:hypothetical protein